MTLESAIGALHQASASAFTSLNDAILTVLNAAKTSTLTGLPNILAFETDFTIAQKSDEPHYLLFGDLNGFKHINDTYTHEAGDAALRRTGLILDLVAKNWHGQAYHKSGDEFAILVSSEHKAGLIKEIEQYLALVILPFDDHNLEFSGSFGCVEITNIGMKDAQERAELACQIAKRRGRTHVVHEWSPDDKLDDADRRLRCAECGTAFRCTLAAEHVARGTLHCPVCQVEVASSTAEPASA